MKPILAGALIVSLMAGLPGYAQLKPQDIRTYADDPYAGNLKLSLYGPDGKHLMNDAGEADVTLDIKSADLLEMKVEGLVPPEGHITVTAKLTPDGKGGWVDTDDELPMLISPDGVISGTGVKDAMEVSYSGQITDVRIELTVQATFLDQHESGLPAGASMKHEFSLQREHLGQARRAAASHDSDCAQIVMQPRTVANVHGGGMSMIMVPVCIPSRKD